MLFYLTRMHDPLSIEVQPGALEAANQKVSEINILPSGGITAGNTVMSSRQSYIKLDITPAQRLSIGKRAAEHSSTATAGMVGALSASTLTVSS